MTYGELTRSRSPAGKTRGRAEGSPASHGQLNAEVSVIGLKGWPIGLE
jgi:hypothetical protein